VTYQLTRESLPRRAYRDRIDDLVPAEGLTIQQVAALDLRAADILWVMVTACGLPDRILRLSAVDSARRALARFDAPDARSIAICDVAERHANGTATDEELRDAREEASATVTADAQAAAGCGLVSAADAALCASGWAVDAAIFATPAESWGFPARVERRHQIASLLRLAEEEERDD